MPYIDDNLHVNSWILSHGGVAEWLKAHDSKSCRPERVSWVQIPPPPPLICIQTSTGFESRSEVAKSQSDRQRARRGQSTKKTRRPILSGNK